jgi:hypothetical protein
MAGRGLVYELPGQVFPKQRQQSNVQRMLVLVSSEPGLPFKGGDVRASLAIVYGSDSFLNNKTHHLSMSTFHSR